MNLTIYRLYTLFTCVLLSVFAATTSFAQIPQYFSSGTGSNNSFPFNAASTGSNKVQWIYIPSEFPGATSGLITKVYFKSATTGTNKSFTNLTIKMGYTTAANTVTGAFQTAGLTTVFLMPSITIPSTTNGSWVMFTLQTPFYYDNSKNLLVEASTTNYVAPGFSVIQNSANGSKRLYGNYSSPTGTAGTGLVNFGFDILAYPDNASVDEIIAPASNICFGSHEVRAVLKNMGSNAINSVKLNWTVNGVPQTPVIYNTPLPIAQSVDVSLGNFNFPMGKKQKLVVWSSEPNGNPDQLVDDDTARLERTAVDKPNGFVLVAGSEQICPGDSILLYALTGQGSLSYQWQFNANDIPGATQNSIYAKNAGFYSISFDNGACTAQSNFQEIIIAPPVIDLGIDSQLCETPTPYVLDPKLANAVAYQWSTGAITPTLEVTKSGTYWVEVTKVPGCFTADTVTLTFDPLPKVTGISYLQQDKTFMFTPGGLQHDVSYLWMFGDGHVSTDKSPTHTYAEAKTRTVMLVVFNACGTDTAMVQLVPTGINDIAGGNGINVYPNPAQDVLHLAVPGTAAAMPVDILNSLGQVVYTNVLPAQERHTINIGHLPAGSYILRVNMGNGMVNKRFDIMR